jgi:hypothetical protein
MKNRRVVRRIRIKEGLVTVYTDLGYSDSDTVLLKAHVVAKIAEIVQRRALAPKLGRPKSSGCHSPRFRGISEPLAGISDAI